MTGNFIWYELVTPDLDAAKAFYDKVVGWTVADRSDFPNGYRMIGRADGKMAGGMIPLTDEMRTHGGRPIWLGYLDVEDVDAAAGAIKADGGQVHLGPFDIPDIGRVAMVTDPVGVPFYVMKPVPPEGQPDAQSDVFDPIKAQHFRWNELSTTDQDGAVAFFTNHFGWTQQGAMPMGEMGDYMFVQADGVGIGAIMPKPSQRPTSGWTYYIGVDDIDRAHEAAKACGATILYDPMEIPGGEYSLAAIDPQGAPFGLVGPRRK